MIGIVVVSHSRRLAEAAVELALQMVRGAPPPIEIAAGLDDHVLGTDAARVKEAIDRVESSEGVLVIMDLGSAVLSAELALELRGGGGECLVVLSDAPLVEGLVAAVALAAAGASLDEVAADASQAGRIKTALLGGDAPDRPADTGSKREAAATIELAVHNEHGLHARPAARFVETVRRFDAEVTVRNLTHGGPAVSGRSVSALSTLGALAGHQIQVCTSGRQAREALAAVAALVRRNFDENVSAGPATPAPPAGRGPVAASPGIGIGPKTSLAAPDLNAADSPADRPEAEREKLLVAIEASRAQLNWTREHVSATAGQHEASIFDAHLLLLDDDELTGAAIASIEGYGHSASAAWRQAVADLASRFSALADPYLRARAQDVGAVGDQVLAHLLGVPTVTASPAGVVVTADLTPTDAALLDPAQVRGIVTAFGSPVSHGAILARSLGIPAVVGAGEDVLAVPDGTPIIVDGTVGTVTVDPSPMVVNEYRQRAASWRVRARDLKSRATRPAVTTDRVRIEVVANIASSDEAVEAVAHGADGVGLLRTEFLFLDRTEPPTEAEQTALYTSVAEALEGRRLTIRTLDVGGDKPVRYLPGPVESNPFLGCRGLRLSLQYPDILKQQLRALVRTGMDHPVTVLFPMVTTIDELRSARALLVEAAVEAGCRPGQLPPEFEIGAMAEVPAFALRVRGATPLVDLISIGTNDLTQYALAAERGNAAVAALADPLDPAILRLISEVTHAAGSGTRVAVCGEVASDPTAAALLVGLGVRELSMTPRAIPEVKEAIRAISADNARHLADLALQRDSTASVRALLEDFA